MTTWQAMNALEGLGYQFIPHGGGVRATLQGNPPQEASVLLEIVRRDRASALAYVLERKAGSTVVDDGCTYSLFDALAIGNAIRRGDARLLGKVVYHAQNDVVTVRWDAVRGNLEEYRERLKNALERRIKAVDEQLDHCATEAEASALLAKWERYAMILEVYDNEQQKEGQLWGA